MCVCQLLCSNDFISANSLRFGFPATTQNVSKGQSHWTTAINKEDDKTFKRDGEVRKRMNGEKRTILHIVEGSFLWRSPNYDDLRNTSSGPESRAAILGMILQCLSMQGVPGIIASLALTEPLALIFVISKKACLTYLIVR